MKRYSLFMVILSLILILGLSQGCDKDNGGGPTEPSPGTTTDTGTDTGTGDSGGGTAFAVTGVTASVDPPSYTGTCPKTFNFSGVISTNGPGTVTYKWERSDGATSPTESIIFDTAGSKTVTKSWTLSPPNYSGWMRLHILTPNDMTSNQASFSVTCVTPDIASPSTVNFGDILCPGTSDHGVIVYNVGPGPSSLNITSANITSGGVYFRKIDDSCTGRNLAGGEHCTIGVRFSTGAVCPPSGTIYSGNLRIRSNDPDEGEVNVSLRARIP